jgi:magnesium-transporting ATPase (P-type)
VSPPLRSQHRDVPGVEGGRPSTPDPLESEQRLLGDLRSRITGLGGREAERRLTEYGPNTIHRRGGRRWWEGLVAQVVHPLAVLLWAAAALAWLAGTPVLAGAIVAVIVINAAFALVQERQAERAVEALAAFLPEQVTVLRDGHSALVEARLLVPGDVIVLQEGDRVPADARLIEGRLQIDISALTGESVPVTRAAGDPAAETVLEAHDLVFSGTSCTGGRAHALVFATGM